MQSTKPLWSFIAVLALAAALPACTAQSAVSGRPDSGYPTSATRSERDERYRDDGFGTAAHRLPGPAVSARGGGRPRAGVDAADAETWIPASLGLSEAELGALAPFDDRARRPFAAEDRTTPFELPALSESGARTRALPLFEAMRCRAVASREGVSQCRGSARLHDVSSHLRVLPIWIGSFRYRDRPWRFVVNGQSARVVGRAPLDRVKVGIAIVLAAIVAIAVLAWLDRDRPEPPPPEPAVLRFVRA